MYSIVKKELAKEFTNNGKFTIRRTEEFWSGTWSDMVIEQELMRSIKTMGGIISGRGITDSTLAKWVASMPFCSIVSNALENFCHVKSHTSDQHVELRTTRQNRDSSDVDKLYGWLFQHNPFSSSTSNLISIS